MGSPSVEPLWSFVDRDQAECSSLSKEKGVSGFELAVVREGIPGQSASVVGEGSKRRRSITKSLKEEATVVKMMPKKKKLKPPRQMSARGSIPPPPATVLKGTGKHPQLLARFVRSLANSFDTHALDVEEAHAAHNMISVLHCPLLKDKLGFLSFDELVDFFDVHTLQTTVRNQDVEGSQVMKDLRSEKARILEKVSMLRSVAAFAEESQKELLEELSGLRPCLEEADHLKQRSQDLEREIDFFLIKSEEVSVLSSKFEAVSLEKAKFKAIIYGRSQALDEVHGLGDSWDFKDVQDYHPEAEKHFDKAAE
ncbi:hypothetical protein Tco_1342498, partial [Tanacetum coccineum]